MTQENGKTIRAVCPHDCPDTCGMVVTVESGRATSLRGDKDHPFTQGYLCQKVARYLDRVYHPDRLKWPLLRTGPKGSAQFRRIGWEEAIVRIAGRFGEIAASAAGPQAILPYSYAGSMGKLQGTSLEPRFFHRLATAPVDRTLVWTPGAPACDGNSVTQCALQPEAGLHAA